MKCGHLLEESKHTNTEDENRPKCTVLIFIVIVIATFR